MIFETHAHYDDEAFAQDRENLLASMQEHGIGYIVNACASIESLKDTEELMEKYPFVYGAFGIHPDDAEKMTEETLEEIRQLCRKLWQSERLGWIITGIKKNMNMKSRRKCFWHRWRLRAKKSFHLWSTAEMRQKIHWIW